MKKNPPVVGKKFENVIINKTNADEKFDPENY